ncbi:hypothetical protein D1872_275440 [compost metagenome]
MDYLGYPPGPHWRQQRDACWRRLGIRGAFGDALPNRTTHYAGRYIPFAWTRHTSDSADEQHRGAHDASLVVAHDCQHHSSSSRHAVHYADDGC